MKLSQLENYKGDCIIDFTGRYDFNAFIKKVDDFGNILKDQIKKNDVIVIDSDYTFFSISLLFALSRTPCIIAPIVKTNSEEFEKKINASGANKVISFSADYSLNITTLNTMDTRNSDYEVFTSNGRSGIVLFSSGTTGVPKVMTHDFTNLIESFAPPLKQKRLTFLLFLMFDHIGGLNTLLSCLNNGASIVIPEDRNPSQILDIIEKESIQVLPTTPTFLNLMLQAEDFSKRSLSSLRLITYGTERMPEELLKKLNTCIPKVRFLQTFGTSETGIMKTQSKSSSSLFFKIIDANVDYKIENGQLFIKSKTSVTGYRGQSSDKFTEDGWFATGDLIEVDNDGYMKIKGRINDVINVGGLKVLPLEIEEIINSIPGIIDTTVYAKQNSITGQMICADIVVEKGIDTSEMKHTINTICRQRLDKYKRPAKLRFSSEISTTSRFKKNPKKDDRL